MAKSCGAALEGSDMLTFLVRSVLMMFVLGFCPVVCQNWVEVGVYLFAMFLAHTTGALGASRGLV